MTDDLSPSARRFRNADGTVMRTPQRLARFSEFAALAAKGWTNPQIAHEMGVTRRTVERYRQRQRSGEVADQTPAEVEFWRESNRLARMRRPPRSKWLLARWEEGDDIVGPDGQPVEFDSRNRYDAFPWVDQRGRRFRANGCRPVPPRPVQIGGLSL